MNDITTSAIVLRAEPKGEQDLWISLFTERLGKVEATAVSGRKITSKLAGHLQPLHVVRVRLTRKNGFRVADALTIRIAPKTLNALLLLNLINQMTVPLAADRALWEALRKSLAGEKSVKTGCRLILKTLGFDPGFASCIACENRVVRFFNKEDFAFLCERCGAKEKTIRNQKTWLAI